MLEARKLIRIGVGVTGIVMSAQFVSAADTISTDVRVHQMSFCGARGAIAPTCERPIPQTGGIFRIPINELPKDDNGNRIVWVWSRSTTPADIKIAYMFTQEATHERWSETIHVNWIDRTVTVLDSLLREFKDTLGTIHNPEGYKYTQAVGFTGKTNSMNRWPVSFIIEERGVFHLSVVKFGRNAAVVPGGERITLHVHNEAASP